MSIKQLSTRRLQRGALMIEVLVTIAVVVIGALGLMQMQGRLQKSEMESYQRTQALILLNDMASRISANRGDAANYVTTGLTDPFLGAGWVSCAAAYSGAPSTLQKVDSVQWCLELQGAAETLSGASVGTMLGGRGCVQPAGADQYMVTVVWQGLTPISTPPVTCGVNEYDIAGTDCSADLCRRYVTTLVSLARLDT